LFLRVESLNFAKYKYHWLLVSATFFWGTTFVIVQEAIREMPVFLFIFSRFVIALVLLCFFLKNRIREILNAFIPGLLTGIFLFGTYAFQTIGLEYTTASNAAFITGLNFIFTPLIGVILFKIKITNRILEALILTFSGFFLLSYNPGMSLNPGDLITFLCSISLAFQILFLDRYLSRGYTSFALLFHQIFWVTLFSLIASLAFEKIEFHYFYKSYPLFAIIFTGVLCSAFGFYAQTVGQKHVSAVKTSLIFILEPLFGALLDFIYNGINSYWKLSGGILILIGILIGETRKKNPVAQEKSSR
jgi:drug/metabolite transporter (DMT)-like permease